MTGGSATGSAELSTQPQEAIRQPGLGPRGFARWAWRQLTSMRVALLLLFLLAVAAVPGSVFPQRGANPGDVLTYLDEHRTLGPWLDRLSMFDVYSAPWFAAIYLLLFISLVGCVLPRSFQHVRAIRSRPPAAPRNLTRFVDHRTFVTDAEPAAVVAAAREALKARWWRVDVTESTVSAEKGYARETGNLLFHIALLFLLVGIAVGALLGTHGSVIVVEGNSFANTLAQYDSFGSGRLAGSDQLPPFSFTLKDFRATYERGGAQDGAPRSFEADLAVRDSPTSQPRLQTVEVNEPLVVAGTKVFLIGHGYAPRITVRDKNGTVVSSTAVPFLPRDGKFTSMGAIKVPDGGPVQFGFRGVFLPTAHLDPVQGGFSTYPAADSPGLLLSLWTGDLGLDTGKPQSVYSLDTSRMKAGPLKSMRVGDVWTLPDGLGSITFDGVSEFASFNIAHDPGKEPAFFAAMTALAGLMLSLFVRRRRLWLRATADAEGRTLVEVAGLAKSEAGGLGRELDELVIRLPAPRPPLPDEEPA